MSISLRDDFALPGVSKKERPEKNPECCVTSRIVNVPRGQTRAKLTTHRHSVNATLWKGCFLKSFLSAAPSSNPVHISRVLTVITDETFLYKNRYKVCSLRSSMILTPTTTAFAFCIYQHVCIFKIHRHFNGKEKKSNKRMNAWLTI